MIATNFKELEVWQRGMEFVTLIYEMSSHFPNREVFGLTDQMRRASVSIPSNIAEGFNRHSRPELARFTDIAICSLGEIETQLIIARNLGYVEDSVWERAMIEIVELNGKLRAFAYKTRHPGKRNTASTHPQTHSPSNPQTSNGSGGGI